MRSKQQKVRKCMGPLSPVVHIAWLLWMHLSRAAKGEAASWDTGKILRIQPTLKHCEHLWGRELPPDAPPGQSLALGAGLAVSWPSSGTGYGWAPTPTQADRSGAQKYPPLAPGATSKLHTTHSDWDGFLASPWQQSGAVFPYFNIGETNFFDTKFYSDPTRGGVFSQKTLLQPPLELQFSFSAGDTIFLNQN